VKAGWEDAKLSTVCDVFTDGNWIESKDQSPDGIRLIQTGNVGEGVFKDRRDKARFIDEATFGRLKCFEVLPGDCLISRLPDPVGRACEIPETGDKMITAVDCSVVRVNDERLNRSFFIYYSQSRTYLREVDDVCSGTTRRRISRKNLGKINIPLPPQDEQKRIVEFLDAAFDGLTRARDHAEANLQNARELFESGLLGVFEGFNNPENQHLLKKVALEFGRGKSKHRPRNDKSLYGGDHPFIQTGDVRNSEHLIETYSQSYNEKGLAQSKLWPVGTVCITIAANIAETGVLCFESCFPDSIIGFVPDKSKTSSKYVEYLLQFFQKRLQALGDGAAQDNINLKTFETEYFPFPSLEAQRNAVKKLDDLLSLVKELESNYRQKFTDIDDLRQSLLQKAFAGELT